MLHSPEIRLLIPPIIKIPGTTNHHDDPSHHHPITWHEEIHLFLALAIPSIFVQLTVTIPDAISISYVGRLTDSIHLDACSLANIILNILCMSLFQGMLSASDTLSPQAFALGNRKEVGLLLMRSYAACLILVIPIIIVALFFLRGLLLKIGEDPDVTSKALDWYHLYLIVAPFDLLFYVIWKFLSAQSIMLPLVIVSSITNLFVLPLCLGSFIRMMGYLGSVISMLVYQLMQITLLILYLNVYHPHKEGTWPGLRCWREAIAWPEIKIFMTLGLGGVLAATEWWFWEIVSALAGSLGVIPFSIHTVPTQVMNVVYMVPVGIGLALNVRLAHALTTNVERAKKLLVVCYFVSLVVVLCIAFLMHRFRWWIFRLFSNEQVVFEGCDRIWKSVILYFINLSIYGVNAGTLIALGKQWLFGLVTFVSLWLVALPTIYFYAVKQNGGIEGLWKCLNPPYIFLNVLLSMIIFLTDWNKISYDLKKKHDTYGCEANSQYKSIGARIN